MSAAGRTEDREASDNYPTPPWCVRRLLDAVDLPDGTWVEPCVGEGSIVRTVAARHGVEWITQDVRPDAFPAELIGNVRAHRTGDFLVDAPADLMARARVVLTNPPFSLAMAFIQRARFLCPDAILVFLLRVNFLGSAERHPWMSRNMPDVYQLPNRPSFVKGKTDSTEYGWFVWKPHAGLRTTGFLHLLPLTSGEERRSGR